ncbi:NADP-dependent oxidoreductase domain-containing protein [Ephemerocybe angulata]|uniref:NADP-dependent oxidoreductase domain-containing protein n=1 Tax=Ephemerocybe angulata TaxID=980116 RepID=A0A8H6MB69_9AGAR|nr:NADP-dependent oxidoreductase domain-containing protein [Tulosesus angulatus]
MSFFAPPPPPKSKLGNYRKFCTLAGVHVSPIILGGMSIGDKWGDYGMGAMNKEDSFKLLDAYYDLGGNFIDTANFYQEGSSEQFIGEWAEAKGIREQLFIATKYSANPRARDPSVEQKVLYGGTNAKSMHNSLTQSLKNLRTDYIDLFYVHWWDYDTTIEELMQALHCTCHCSQSSLPRTCISQVLSLSHKLTYHFPSVEQGISDAPAWVVAQANQYARDHALTPFCVYQGLWNVLDRSIERDIIPMARQWGMALAPWSVLAAGKIRTDEEEERRIKSGEQGRQVFGPWLRNDKEKAVCKVLEKIAGEIGAKSISSIAIAYVMHKARFVFPIIGGRKVDHLVANLEALDLSLSDEHIKEIEAAVPFDPGFPHNMIGDGTAHVGLHKQSGHLEFWPLPAPITGKK